MEAITQDNQLIMDRFSAYFSVPLIRFLFFFKSER